MPLLKAKYPLRFLSLALGSSASNMAIEGFVRVGYMFVAFNIIIVDSNHTLFVSTPLKTSVEVARTLGAPLSETNSTAICEIKVFIAPFTTKVIIILVTAKVLFMPNETMVLFKLRAIVVFADIVTEAGKAY